MSWIYAVPFLGSIGLGAGTILEKIILKHKQVSPKIYQPAGFLAIVIVMIPLLFFFWKLEAAALSLSNLLIFFAVVIFSILANVFVFYSMKWEKLTNLEPAKLLEPLFVILLAIVFSFIFGEALFERNFKVIIPAIIAGLALLFSHLKRHHLSFNKYFVAAIIGSFFFALELVISRLILDLYSPISFYFLRSFFVFLVSFVIFKPNFSKLNYKIKWQIFIAGAIWVVYRVMIYYGYINLGIIFTTLIVMLGPIFIYLFVWKFLHEKPSWKNALASVIIIASVLYALLA